MPPNIGPWILVVMCRSSAGRDTYMLNHVLHFLWRCCSHLGYREGHRKVHDRTDTPEGVGFDTHEPVGR